MRMPCEYDSSFQRKLNKQADLLCPSSQHHDSEDEEHGEPDLPDDSGVGLDLVQQRGQETPISHDLSCSDLV